MAFEVYKVDQPKGVNFTREPSQLPPMVWDNAENVTFRHGITKKVTGYEQGFGTTPTLYGSGAFPMSILALRDDSQEYYWWAYSTFNSIGSPKIFRITSVGNHEDVTPTGMDTMSNAYKWTNDSINAVPYFTYQSPYKWDGASKFTAYKYFPSHIDTKVVRTYKNFHIAMNFKTRDFDPNVISSTWCPELTSQERSDYISTFGAWNAGSHQNAIWWSSSVVGKDTDVPWSDADPTKDSGWNFLGGGGGPIIDGKSMRDSFMIYRERSVWQMTYVGGINVFAFKEIFTDAGCLSLDCVAEIEGQHYVIGQSDIYVHNGVQKKSIADGVIRKEIFDSIDPNYIENVFISTKYQDKELWVCIPEATTNFNGLCNVAYVYNWEEGTWSRRDIPNTVCSVYTILSISQDDISWRSESEGGPLDVNSNATQPDYPGCTWEETTDTWLDSQFDYNPSQWGLAFGGMLPDGSGGALYTSIKEPLLDEQNFTAIVEKKWMDMGDRTQYKTINKLYPMVREGVVDCYVSGTSTIDEAPEWKFIGEFDPLKRMHLACHATGRYLHVKFVINNKSRAEIRGYAVDFIKSGTR